MIFSFRYRDGVRGVVTRHMDAASLPEADAQAIAWVAKKPGAFYIANSVEAWLITLDDLPTVAAQPAESQPAKPSQKEQRDRLQADGAARRAGTGVGSSAQQTERVGA